MWRPSCCKPCASPQLLQQRLRLFQIGCVEAFGEPVVDWREQIRGFGGATLNPARGQVGIAGKLCVLSRGVRMRQAGNQRDLPITKSGVNARVSAATLT